MHNIWETKTMMRWNSYIKQHKNYKNNKNNENRKRLSSIKIRVLFLNKLISKENRKKVALNMVENYLHSKKCR